MAFTNIGSGIRPNPISLASEDVDELLCFVHECYYGDDSQEDPSIVNIIKPVICERNDNPIYVDDRKNPENSEIPSVTSHKKRKTFDFKVQAEVKKSVVLPLYSSVKNQCEFLVHFPNEFFGAAGAGDLHSLGYMINKLSHKNCAFRRTDTFRLERSGAKYIYLYYRAVLNSFPDSVFQLNDIKVKPSNEHGLILIKCKFNFSGTLITRAYLDEFYGIKTADVEIVSLLDKTSLSDEELKSFEKSDVHIREKNKSFYVTGITKANFYYDPNIKSIVGYSESYSVKSFNTLN